MFNYILFDVNLFSILVLIILYVLHKDTLTTTGKIVIPDFKSAITYATIYHSSWVILRVLNTYSLPYAILIKKIIYAILNSSLCFICILFVEFIYYFVTSSSMKKEQAKKIKMFAHIISIILFMAILFTNLFFKYDNYSAKCTNGSFYLIIPLIISIPLAISLFLIFKNRKNISLENMVTIVVITIIPIICSYLNFVLNIYVLPVGITISLIMILLQICSNYLDSDSLTRLKLTDYIIDYTANSKNTNYSVAILDIDDLQRVNIKHSISIGDNVIISFSNMIKSLLPKDAFAVRYCGNTFLVYFDNTSKEEAATILSNLQKKVDQFNINAGLNITYTSYFEKFDQTKYASFLDFLQNLKNQVYELKLTKRFERLVTERNVDYNAH